MSRILISYDIREEKRRAKVRKISKNRGEHHQLSVFLVREGTVKNIFDLLGVFIEEEVDRLLVAKLKGEEITLGGPYETFRWRF